MVETALTALTTSEAGARIDASTYYSAAHTDGHTFANDGDIVIFCKNTDVAVDPILTVTGQGACPFGVIHNRTYTMTHGQSHVIGPFSTAHYNDTSSLVHLAWSATEADCIFFIIRRGPTLS
jgi:hypothetical protein